MGRVKAGQNGRILGEAFQLFPLRHGSAPTDGAGTEEHMGDMRAKKPIHIKLVYFAHRQLKDLWTRLLLVLNMH